MKTEQEKILVTGGGGFLGHAIVKQLIKKGHSVRSFSRSRYPALDSMDIEQIQGDIGDKDTVQEACRGMNAVFHVAAKPGVWGPYSEFYRTNVTGTQNIITACKQYGISRLIYTSSPSVIFDGKDMEGVDESVPYPDKYHAHYPKTKAMAEQSVLKATLNGLPAIVIRPHIIWGPGDNHLIPRIIARAKKLKIIGNGQNRVDTIYVDNAAEAHILAFEKLAEKPELSGNIYFISQDQPVLLWKMINSILAAAGLKPVKRSVPKGAAFLAGAVLELIYKAVNARNEPMMTRFVARELGTSHWFNIDAAKKDLNYSPRISIEEGLKILEEWFKNKGVHSNCQK